MAVSKAMKTKTTDLGFSPYKLTRGEEYMNGKQQEHFRKILFEWKKQLMEEVDSTVVHLKEEANVYADPLDRASQEEGFSLELRTRDRERKLIKKIEQAADTLDNGDYGFCKDCGAEIGIRRLEARPTATKCIDCKTFEEIREKQSGG
ncbi:RNA polymerase-binding protein DksA [Coxiella endosymbiont of Ornithodoros maritimus]|uniref:RNA polymerase-binding protein DksA n=1 Tax=Coxiella endosymbiont of Ornithodoros maritimus TaxID=1656172 RepID=UPI0022640B9E|nr:RNA polymerase-binding protein DksA [Coxiella endosymbiont of Ornithodoros maritimus]